MAAHLGHNLNQYHTAQFLQKGLTSHKFTSFHAFTVLTGPY